MRTETDHGLDCEAHAWFRLANRLVLCVMWYVGRAVEQLVDTMSAVRSDYAAILCLCVLLNNVSVLAKQCTGLDNLDSLVQAFPCCLSHPHCVWVRQRFVSNIECLVQIRVETAVVY